MYINPRTKIKVQLLVDCSIEKMYELMLNADFQGNNIAMSKIDDDETGGMMQQSGQPQKF
jgi:hypothetical protein